MAFEAYQVAVKVALHDGVSKALLGMSAQFGILQKEADRFQKKLEGIKRIAIIGAGIGGAGFLGLGMISKALKPAEEYAHQLNIMNMAGLKHQEIAQAISTAWKTTNTVITSTAVGNLKTFMDLRNIFGKSDEAIKYLPELARIQGVLGASSNGSISQNSENLVYSLAKALDIRGAVNSSAQFNAQAEMMAKVIMATQGRVLPQDYQMLFKYGRQGVPGLSNRFLYEELPTLMQQMKGTGGGGSSGGFGTSIAAFYKFFVQGIMTKAALQGMIGLGLIDSHAGLKTSTRGTQLMQGEHVRQVGLAQSDPFQYVQSVLLPAIRKKYGDNLTKNQLSLAIGDAMRGASVTAIFGVLQYALKAQQIYRDQGLIQRARNPMEAYRMAISNDPNTIKTAFSAQWENFKTAFTVGALPIIMSGMITLTHGLNILALALKNHPMLAKTLALGFIALFSSMVAVGSILLVGAAGQGLVAGFKVLRLALIPLLTPLSGLAIALTAIGIAAYEIYKHWGAIKSGASSAEDWVKSKFGFDAGGAQSNHAVIHNHIFLDGRQISSSVTKAQSREFNRQPAHGSSFNSNLNLGSNMNNYPGYNF